MLARGIQVYLKAAFSTGLVRVEGAENLRTTAKSEEGECPAHDAEEVGYLHDAVLAGGLSQEAEGGVVDPGTHAKSPHPCRCLTFLL